MKFNEPKVLTENKLLRMWECDEISTNDLIEISHKNGRLEMWLEFESYAREMGIDKSSWLNASLAKIKP